MDKKLNLGCEEFKKRIIKIKVPHFSRGFTHSEHNRGFDVSFPYYFQPSFVSYQGFTLELKKMRLHWFAQPYLKRRLLSRYVFYFGMIFGKIMDFLANLSPFLCSRMWCFLVGGFEEIEFEFIVKKNESRDIKFYNLPSLRWEFKM